eukprot:6503552-Pyramimonas_sp.AAC.1
MAVERAGRSTILGCVWWWLGGWIGPAPPKVTPTTASWSVAAAVSRCTGGLLKLRVVFFALSLNTGSDLVPGPSQR